MRKTVFGAMLASVAFFSTAYAEDLKIGVSIPAADHGWTSGVVFHANRVAQEVMGAYDNVEIIVKTSPDAASQANALQDLEVQGIDALVILPTDPDALVNAIMEVKSNGAFVALVDRAPSNNDASVRDLYVAGNNFGLGEVAGHYIAANNPDAKVAIIRGMPIPIDQMRQDGFDAGIAGSGVEVLDRQFGNWNRDDAFLVMQDYLTKYDTFDVVWCQDDDMAVGVLQAIEESGRTDIKYVIGGAGSKDMIKMVMDGNPMMPVDVLYPPAMVGTAIEMTVAGLVGQVPVAGVYTIDATLVTPENASQYYFADSPF